MVTDRWKAVRLNAIKAPDGPVELFDLSTDIEEQTNVAADHPDEAKRFERWMRESHRDG